MKFTDLVFFDTETASQEWWLIQLGLMQKHETCEWFAIIDELFKPTRPIDLSAMAVHWIRECKVKDKDYFKQSSLYAQVQNRLFMWVPVAHNARFDLKVMDWEWIKYNSKSICTHKVAYHLFDIEHYWLQYLRYYFNVDDDQDYSKINPHDAISDVIILIAVFKKLWYELQTQEFCGLDEAIDIMIEISSKPILLRKMTFGKHKGVLMPALDRNYVKWCYEQDDFISDKEDLKYSFDYYFKK